MVGFYCDLSKKSIPLRADLGAIDLPNATLIARPNYTPLLNGGSNYLLSTSQAHEFCVTIHDIYKPRGGKQYVHVGDRVIDVKFDKVLVCVPIQ